MSVVLITGASRGLGAHLARALAAAGHTVFAGVRRVGELDEPRRRVDPRPLHLDVCDGDTIRAATERIAEETGGLDVLVNNAGVAWLAAAEEVSQDALRATFATNFFGAVACTQAFLPAMRERRSGRVIMITSLGARAALPLESAYCASKSAVEAFAESLRAEVGRFGIHVSVIEPGGAMGGLSGSRPVAETRRDSPYSPLLAHVEHAYGEAPQPCDGPDLVVEAVEEILRAEAPGFRYAPGRRASLVNSLEVLSERRRFERLRELLGIDWWCRPAAPVG